MAGGSRGWHPFHHALARANSLEMIALLLDHGADPSQTNDGITAVARAAREGRNDVLELFRQRGISVELFGLDRLIAACAMGDSHCGHRQDPRDPAGACDPRLGLGKAAPGPH